MIHDIQIRPVTKADCETIGQIAETSDLFPAAILPEMIAPFLEEQRTDHVWLVACEGEDILGFCFCEPERLTSGTANMLALATLLDRRSEGIGSRLVARLEEHCRQRGDRVMLVETAGLPQFERTRGFYRREGYVQVAVIPDYYDEGEDKIVFHKRLEQQT